MLWLIFFCIIIVIAIGVLICQPDYKAHITPAIGEVHRFRKFRPPDSDYSQNEVGILAGEFNQMAAKLKESYSNLEQKVEETSQLLRAEVLGAVGELAADSPRNQ